MQLHSTSLTNPSITSCPKLFSEIRAFPHGVWMPQPIKSRKTEKTLILQHLSTKPIRLTLHQPLHLESKQLAGSLQTQSQDGTKARRISGCWPQKNLLPLFPGDTCSDEDAGRLNPSTRVQGSGRFCRLSNYMGSPTTPSILPPLGSPLMNVEG